ncbi:hypothetical protein B9Z55_010905 [Caenorhabditis nigoni]|uniref:Uncharacterized protein n=1 Tax=Caenorhabditis nigoni TaxID=1611254 RepID=A0A2G5UHT4_9PELO|nr:hypothetical protein B9Z55_010905 [Caenorhabditis nigoni]
MSQSLRIRRRIRCLVFYIRSIGDLHRQILHQQHPMGYNPRNMDMKQLQKMMKKNWKIYHRLMKYHNLLIIQNDAWAALIEGNPEEEEKHKRYVESNGNYMEVLGDCLRTIRHCRRIYEATVREIIRRCPDSMLPLCLDH